MICSHKAFSHNIIFTYRRNGKHKVGVVALLCSYAFSFICHFDCLKFFPDATRRTSI